MEDRLEELQSAGGSHHSSKKLKFKRSKKDKHIINHDHNNNQHHIHDNKSDDSDDHSFHNSNEDDDDDGVEEDQEMISFYDKVGRIKLKLTNVRRTMQLIQEKQLQSVNEINIIKGVSDKDGGIDHDINTMMHQLFQQLKQIKLEIDGLKNENNQYTTNHAKDNQTTNIKIRSNLYDSLIKKLMDLIKEHKEMEDNIKTQFKEKMERQYKIVKPDISDQEVKDLTDSVGSTNHQGFMQNIFVNTTLNTQLALGYIQNRHNEILVLERSIAELHQLFIDMSILVDSQGRILSEIENDIISVAADTKEGVDNLAVANKRYRRCTIM